MLSSILSEQLKEVGSSFHLTNCCGKGFFFLNVRSIEQICCQGFMKTNHLPIFSDGVPLVHSCRSCIFSYAGTMMKSLRGLSMVERSSSKTPKSLSKTSFLHFSSKANLLVSLARCEGGGSLQGAFRTACTGHFNILTLPRLGGLLCVLK